MKKILFVIIVSALFTACSPSSGVFTPHYDVCCQAYKVVGTDTTKIEDVDTYINTDQTPAQLEAWWGIKPYASGGYSYYDCWLK